MQSTTQILAPPSMSTAMGVAHQMPAVPHSQAVEQLAPSAQRAVTPGGGMRGRWVGQINSQYHPNQEVEQPPGASSQARASPGPGPGEVFLQGEETETLHKTVICTHKECK